jgi:ferredoxin-NADP reductase
MEWQLALVAAGAALAWYFLWRHPRPIAGFGDEKASLSRTEFRPFVVLRSKQLTHNTRLTEFAGNIRDMTGPGMHLSVREPGGKTRPYSPTQCQPNSFFIAVKRYSAGTVSSYVHSLQPGESAMLKGPVGSFNLNNVARGAWMFLAAGSGVTPVFSVLRATVVEGEGLRYKIVLLLSNSTPDDVMLRDELAELETLARGMLTVRHVISSVEGRISTHKIRDAIEQQVAPVKVAFVGLCGPLGYCDAVSASFDEPEVAALCNIHTNPAQNKTFWRF